MPILHSLILPVFIFPSPRAVLTLFSKFQKKPLIFKTAHPLLAHPTSNLFVHPPEHPVKLHFPSAAPSPHCPHREATVMYPSPPPPASVTVDLLITHSVAHPAEIQWQVIGYLLRRFQDQICSGKNPRISWKCLSKW